MHRSYVSTFAGLCGTKGFMDGPQGINRLNSPTGIGIDVSGDVVIYDKGNSYMRLIKQDGYVQTLVNGACYEYKHSKERKNNLGYKVSEIVCFK